MSNYEFNDSHIHLTNYCQEGPDIRDFLKMMGDTHQSGIGPYSGFCGRGGAGRADPHRYRETVSQAESATRHGVADKGPV